MTKKQRDRLFKRKAIAELKLMQRKAHDYSNNDVLSSFKKCAEVANCTAPQVALIEVAKKLARLSELLNNKKPKNESIEDSITDARNYLFLLSCLLNE